MTSEDQSPHVADQAGGEAIFSSDGLAPIPKPPAPKSRYSKNDNEDGLDDGGSHNMNPLQAFEVFAGTVFPTKPNESSSSIGIPRRRIGGESRLESLARIESELKALELDVAASSSGGDETSEVDPNVRAERDLMQQLSQRLVQLSTTTSSNVQQRHLDLNSIVQSQVQQLKETKQNTTTDATPPPKEEVVYELYSNKDGGGADTMTPQQLQRLERLEQCLGPLSSGGISSLSLLERLAKAEDTLTSIEPSSLDLAASRAKVIRYVTLIIKFYVLLVSTFLNWIILNISVPIWKRPPKPGPN